MDEPVKTGASSVQWKLLGWLLAAVWTVVIAGSVGWNLYLSKQEMVSTAQTQARALHQKDIVYREWNAEHGGVYALISERTTPNPYLEVPEREITTPLGRKLTKINPAYMTRQVHELGYERYGAIGHITSLNPIRPENAADPWEVQALEAFEQGAEEVSSIEEIEGEAHMRLMRPLTVTKSCLACHAAQGYEEGDIRGGISVSMPMAPLLAVWGSRVRWTLAGHALFWLIGLVGIGLGTRRLAEQRAKQEGTERQIRESEEKFRGLFESSNDAIMILDDNSFLDCNNAALKMFDCSTREDFFGKHPADLSPPEQPGGEDSRTAAAECMAIAFREGRNHFEWTHRRLDGEDFPAEVLLTPVIQEGKALVQATVRDITERKHLERELRTLATTDPLTGAFNRRSFLEKGSDIMAQYLRYKRPTSVLMMDIDHFKQINDTFGHHVGDDVLKALVKECLVTVRKSDVFGRLGGEEFGVILMENDSEQSLQVAERIRQRVANLSVGTESGPVNLTISIGLTYFQDDDATLEMAMQRADKALYEAKDTGRNRVVSHEVEIS